MPYITAGVWSENETVKAECMTLQQQLLVALEAADQYIRNNSDKVATSLKSLLKDLQWHRWQISLESLETARRAGYSHADPRVRLQSLNLHGGQSNTKWTAEDVFSHLAHISQRAQKGCSVMNKIGPRS